MRIKVIFILIYAVIMLSFLAVVMARAEENYDQQPNDECEDIYALTSQYHKTNCCVTEPIVYYTRAQGLNGDATADAQAKYTECFDYSPGYQGGLYYSDDWNVYRIALRTDCSGENVEAWAIYVYPTEYGASHGCEVGVYTDSDDDGIPDDIDPFPDDPDDFSWHIIGFQKDENGNITYMTVRVVKNGVESFHVFGDYDPDQPISLEPNPVTKHSDDWMDYFGGSEGSISEDGGSGGGPGNEMGFGDHDQEFGGGTGNDGNSEQVEYLEDIVSNTKEIADNQGVQGGILDDISKRLEEQNQILANKKFEVDVGDVDVDNSGVEQRLDDVNEELSSTEGDDALASGENYDAVGARSDMQGELGEGEIPDEESLVDQSWFTDFINSNPYKSALENSGIQTSGAYCSASVTTSLGSFDMDMCSLGPAFQDAGVILLQITALLSLIIIVRG